MTTYKLWSYVHNCCQCICIFVHISSLFGGGGGLFGGLGGKPSAENANKNVFGGTFNTGNTGTASQGHPSKRVV